MTNKILVTGCAGFIGSHTCEYLLKNTNNIVYGLDNLDPYYSVDRKKKNLSILTKYKNFHFFQEDILTTQIIKEKEPNIVIHLAALAGVRNSLINPERYAQVNIVGFIHLLEQFRELPNIKSINDNQSIKENKLKYKFIFASSSSVYGTNKKVPFEETDELNNINSPYAASKRAMEIYAQTYSQLYNLNLTGLRLFTVYGPRGRPDMAPYKFTEAIKNGEEILKFGDGNSFRDYTYVSDIVGGIIGSMNSEKTGYNVYNLGNGNPINLNQFIELSEKVIGKKANVKQIENQEGDVPGTYSNIDKAKSELNYEVNVMLDKGLEKI